MVTTRQRVWSMNYNIKPWFCSTQTNSASCPCFCVNYTFCLEMALKGITTSTAPARTSFISQPNATGTSNPSLASASTLGMSPELEQTLSLLSAHRSVLGYMLLSRGHPVSIIRHSGVIFDGEQGRKYASAIGRIVESVQTGLEEVHAGTGDGDEVRFLRIRTKRHEIMISPDERYLLAVLQDPAS